MASETRKPTISLSGMGEVSARPDMAVVTTGVVSEAKTARDALDENTRSMSKILKEMKASGIEAKDLQTSGFSVQPKYVHPPKRPDGHRPPPYIAGYRVSNQLSIRVRNLADLGRILDAAVTLGANQINGISFALSNPAELRDEARRQAMADAIRKARLYTGAAGVELGPVVSISEGSVRPPQPMVLERRMAASMKAAEDVPVEAGEQTLRIHVNVTWELVQ